MRDWRRERGSSDTSTPKSQAHDSLAVLSPLSIDELAGGSPHSGTSRDNEGIEPMMTGVRPTSPW